MTANAAGVQPHVCLGSENVREVVITVGDPDRAKKLAERCEQHIEMKYNREYRSFDCKHKGKCFTVISHGVGCPGATVCFEELIKCGAKIICRAGTCGSLAPDHWKQGDIILCTAAVRDDGTSERMIPMGFPAVADIDQLLLLENVLKELGTRYTKGMMVSTDLFYPGLLPTNLDLWAKANVVGVEMENSALFVVASLRGVKAVALGVIDGSPLRWEQGDYGAHSTLVAEGKLRAINAVIEWGSRASNDAGPLQKI